jgi:outer membrane biogenesis lipoprotein LolB
MTALLVAMALAAGLAGCVGVPAAPPDTAVAGSPAVARDQFTMSGRFSAKSEREQVSGQFRYAETPAVRTLSLFSPLGTAVADIVATGDRVTLTQANGAMQSAASVSELLRTVIDLPVSDRALSFWLQGLPSGGIAGDTTMERDASGWPSRFVESGWEIQVSERFADSGGPRRMRWSLAGQPETEVRWVIDAWSAP